MRDDAARGITVALAIVVLFWMAVGLAVYLMVR